MFTYLVKNNKCHLSLIKLIHKFLQNVTVVIGFGSYVVENGIWYGTSFPPTVYMDVYILLMYPAVWKQVS
jgi:hypothetical protein